MGSGVLAFRSVKSVTLHDLELRYSKSARLRLTEVTEGGLQNEADCIGDT